MDAITEPELLAELEKLEVVAPGQGGPILRALLGELRTQLLKGKEVVLPDFASIRLVENKAQIVRDPETGHQYISQARNVVSFKPVDDFQQEIKAAKLSNILLAVPSNDPFAQITEFHFQRVGWHLTLVNSKEECLKEISDGGAYLVIVDFALPAAQELVEALKVDPETANVPVVGLYPPEGDPELALEFMVLPDEHLVEPFEVYTLLMLAEGELDRSSEEEIFFDQQVSFQLGSTEENLERAIELASSLFAKSKLDEEGQLALQATFREACANAVRHGNKENPKLRVSVVYLLDKEKITLVIRDEGEGFDHAGFSRKVAGQTAVEAARERIDAGGQGGLGIKLMQRCCDRVEFNDVGNMITLTKKLESQASPEPVEVNAPPPEQALPAVPVGDPPPAPEPADPGPSELELGELELEGALEGEAAGEAEPLPALEALEALPDLPTTPAAPPLPDFGGSEEGPAEALPALDDASPLPALDDVPPLPALDEPEPEDSSTSESLSKDDLVVADDQEFRDSDEMELVLPDEDEAEETFPGVG